MKKYIITSIVCFALGIITSGLVDKIHDKKVLEKSEYNMCVRVLINEDEILEGCDKYFLEDKWYNDFMEIMFKDYEEIK